ncbi:hypothetical protein B0H14DRAFT_3474178 [Mycena olivaceomarginata]|nr:hypothetical protein B0H14DRAFT_3474178 [Mycena olivaceomarginata]
MSFSLPFAFASSFGTPSPLCFPLGFGVLLRDSALFLWCDDTHPRALAFLELRHLRAVALFPSFCCCDCRASASPCRCVILRALHRAERNLNWGQELCTGGEQA